MDRKRVAENIRNIRRMKNLSAYELSLRVGKSTNYIHEVEKGKINISLGSMLAICHELEIDPKELFD